ncbi:hypothetical protein BDV95DRAFT_180459 [Massariosphaeria phaeospora]|uniref:Uncharacterized protein n=1 Tax=Massariosphaeria phaeospora TaxID=100035 RepID=A0A7C8M3V1_9PLEO|nr:hypothetical protein BDV95DRAFT_180459 [Massariosphaeria phaeospora]
MATTDPQSSSSAPLPINPLLLEASPPNHSATASSPLFRLPRELRDLIYALCRENVRFWITHSNWTLGISSNPFAQDCEWEPPLWLLTCKQLLVEGLEDLHRNAYLYASRQNVAKDAGDMEEARLMHMERMQNWTMGWLCIHSKGTAGAERVWILPQLPSHSVLWRATDCSWCGDHLVYRFSGKGRGLAVEGEMETRLATLEKLKGVRKMEFQLLMDPDDHDGAIQQRLEPGARKTLIDFAAKVLCGGQEAKTGQCKATERVEDGCWHVQVRR